MSAAEREKEKLELTFQQIHQAFAQVAQKIEKVRAENAQLRRELNEAKIREKLHIHFGMPLCLNYNEQDVSRV